MNVPRGRVLIVDDDDDVRMATQDAMERRGYEVVAVSSGAEALSFIAHDTPGIILLDLEMADMNGFEVLTLLRSDPKYRGVQVVVVTGSGAKLPAHTKMLRKPFKIDALIDLLDGAPDVRAS